MTNELRPAALASMATQSGRRGLGFTLLECMVSLVVACLGMLALAKLQVYLRTASDDTRQQLEASHLAQQKIEELRSIPYAALAAGADPGIVATSTTYRRWWSVEPDPQGAPFQQATVNLAWDDRAGRLQTLNLTTLIARKDPSDVARLSLVGPATSVTTNAPASRHADVPVLAIDLGDGTSALAVGTAVSVYSNLTGAVLAICAWPAGSAPSSQTITTCVGREPDTDTDTDTGTDTQASRSPSMVTLQ